MKVSTLSTFQFLKKRCCDFIFVFQMLIVAENSPNIAFYFKRVTAFIDSCFFFFYFFCQLDVRFSEPFLPKHKKVLQEVGEEIYMPFRIILNHESISPKLKSHVYPVSTQPEFDAWESLWGGTKMFPLQRNSKQTNRIEGKKKEKEIPVQLIITAIKLKLKINFAVYLKTGLKCQNVSLVGCLYFCSFNIFRFLEVTSLRLASSSFF